MNVRPDEVSGAQNVKQDAASVRVSAASAVPSGRRDEVNGRASGELSVRLDEASGRPGVKPPEVNARAPFTSGLVA